MEVQSHLTPLADSPQQTRGGVLRRVSERVLTAGFARVRFWEYGWDVATRSDCLVLRHKFPPEDSTSPGIGYTVDVKASVVELLAATSRSMSPKVVRADADRLRSLGDKLPQSVYELGLVDREWLEVKVTFADHVFGILAADREPGETVGQSELARFEEFADDLAVYLTANLYQTLQHHAYTRMSTGKGHLNDTPSLDNAIRLDSEGLSEPDRLVAQMMASLAKSLDAACAAAFRYTWDTDLLDRIASVVNVPGRHPDPPPERYSTVNSPDLPRSLTGHAWKDRAFQLILDYRAIGTYLPEEVDPRSDAWHREILGEVRSVLYAIVGEQDRRYVLRFVNRLTTPQLPFAYEQTLLDNLAAAWAYDFGFAVVQRRLRLLQDATEHVRNAAGLPSEAAVSTLAESLKEGMRLDGINSFALFTAYDSLDGIQLVGSYGPAFETLTRSDRWFQTGDDALLPAILRHVPKKGRLPALDLDLFSDVESAIAASLRNGKPYPYRQVAYARIQQSDHTIFGLVPLRTAEPIKLYPDSPGTAEAASALHTYCELASNALSARTAQLLAAGARRALGSIAHEVRTPVTLLGSLAESAIEQALASMTGNGISDLGADFPLEMKVWSRRIQQRQQQITLITDLSLLLAQESVDQVLQMHIRRANLYHAIGEIAEDLEYESRVDPRLRFTKVDISGCKRLPEIGCDLELLRVALTNVIRNAVKYSLPPGGGENPVVTVTGSAAERRAIIDVRNFGFGIPDDVRPSIFSPFVRGEIQDERKALRGMGLGLFLAKRICEAHEGGVRLISSRAVFNNQRRLEKNEGFETHFQLWVSLALADGPREHRWAKLAPRTAPR
jgi:signal transduction histidine kinase